MSVFKKGRTNVKDDPSPLQPISTTSEKDINTVNAIVNKDARYTMEEISDTSGLTASLCVFHLERKVKIKESVHPLDPAFPNF
jgi:hypothetical protein